MSQFTVRGSFEGRDGRRSYEKTVDADNENLAKEYVYSQIGSQHGQKRQQIEIEEVSA